jgi:hypothetical protein
VPPRALGELLGATMHRDAYQQQIVVTQATHTVVLTVGRRTYTVDGTPHVGDAAPVIVPPRSTLVPLRFVREALGLGGRLDRSHAPGDRPTRGQPAAVPRTHLGLVDRRLASMPFR